MAKIKMAKDDIFPFQNSNDTNVDEKMCMNSIKIISPFDFNSILRFSKIKVHNSWVHEDQSGAKHLVFPMRKNTGSNTKCTNSNGNKIWLKISTASRGQKKQINPLSV